MNDQWIDDSHNSAELFNTRSREHDDLRIIRVLDAAGMFETSWLLFDHHNNTKYGYPAQDE